MDAPVTGAVSKPELETPLTPELNATSALGQTLPGSGRPGVGAENRLIQGGVDGRSVGCEHGAAAGSANTGDLWDSEHEAVQVLGLYV